MRPAEREGSLPSSVSPRTDGGFTTREGARSLRSLGPRGTAHPIVSSCAFLHLLSARLCTCAGSLQKR